MPGRIVQMSAMLLSIYLGIMGKPAIISIVVCGGILTGAWAISYWSVLRSEKGSTFSKLIKPTLISMAIAAAYYGCGVAAHWLWDTVRGQ